MFKVRADLGGWLVIISSLIGVIVIIVGQFPFPTIDGWMVAEGFTARFVGVGFLSLAMSFWGIFNHTNSPWAFMVQRMLVHCGIGIILAAYAYLAIKMFPGP